MSASITHPGRAAPRFVAGVDGGGSGTRVRLQERSGAARGIGSAGPSGLSQGIEQAWCHVALALDAAFADAGVARPANAQVALGLGLAGVESEPQRRAFLAADPGFARCVLFSDAETTLQGAFGERAGIAIAAGTGSVGMARRHDGSLQRAGGWGFPLGDEGGGAWIGQHAVQLAQRAIDGRAPVGALVQAVWHIAGRDAAALLRWCATAGQQAFAQLAPLVFEAARDGDAAAEALLDAAAHELAALAHALSADDATLPIVLTGGIGTRLHERWPVALRARLVAPQGDSADGALALLRAALSGAAPR